MERGPGPGLNHRTRAEYHTATTCSALSIACTAGYLHTLVLPLERVCYEPRGAQGRRSVMSDIKTFSRSDGFAALP